MADPNKDHPRTKDVPIGLPAKGSRREFDSMGYVDVPADRYWGAQTQRSLQRFSIGHDRMPKEVYHEHPEGVPVPWARRTRKVAEHEAVQARGSHRKLAPTFTEPRAAIK